MEHVTAFKCGEGPIPEREIGHAPLLAVAGAVVVAVVAIPQSRLSFATGLREDSRNNPAWLDPKRNGYGPDLGGRLLILITSILFSPAPQGPSVRAASRMAESLAFWFGQSTGLTFSPPTVRHPVGRQGRCQGKKQPEHDHKPVSVIETVS